MIYSAFFNLNHYSEIHKFIMTWTYLDEKNDMHVLAIIETLCL